jgi:hypothetical protein
MDHEYEKISSRDLFPEQGRMVTSNEVLRTKLGQLLCALYGGGNISKRVYSQGPSLLLETIFDTSFSCRTAVSRKYVGWFVVFRSHHF